MRTYFLGAFYISITLLSCGQQKESDHNVSNEAPVSTKISEKDISQFKFLEYRLDIKTEKEIENWTSFKELEDLVNLAFRQVRLCHFCHPYHLCHPSN